MARAKPERQNPSAPSFERPANSRAIRSDERRESTFHSLSRTISRAFSKAVGRPSEQEENENPLANESRNSSENMSTVSSSSKAPATEPARNFSAARKPSIDFSLLKRQSDLRVPAHLVIEAYREALRARRASPQEVATVPSISQRNNNIDNADSAVATKTSSSLTPTEPTNQLVTPLPASHLSRKHIAKLSRSDNGRVRKATRPKPLKHRIQLITKPLVNLAELSEDRKHRPGFISANFDVSDDEEENKGSTENSDAGTQKATASSSSSSSNPEPATLLRRPQVESTKLKRHAEESERPESSTSGTSAVATEGQKEGFVQPPSKKPLFAFAGGDTASSSQPAPKLGGSGFSFGSAKTAESSKPAEPSKPAETDAPKFSFGSKPAAGTDSGAPKFIFGGPSSSEKPASSPKFSFGAANPVETAKPAEVTPAEPAKPTFSFSKPAVTTEKPAESSETTSSKPAFSFGGASTTDISSSGGKPLFNFSSKPAEPASSGDAAAKKPEEAPKFSFGSSQPSADPSAPKPFSFGAPLASTESKLNEGRPAFGSISSKPEETKSAGELAKPLFGSAAGASDDKPKPSFTFGSSEPAKPAAPAAAPASSDKPSFNFGSTNSTTPAFGTAGSGDKLASGFSFGNKPAADKQTTPAANGVFSFGASAASDKTTKTALPAAPAAPPSDTSTPAFGAPATNTASTSTAEKPASSAFTFGGASASNGAANTGFSFGKSSSQPPAAAGSASTAGPQSTFSFGSKPATPQPFAFGGGNSTTGTTNTASGGSAFGGSKEGSAAPATNTNTNGPAPFAFGQPASSTTSAFGAPAPPSQNQQPASIFGASQPGASAGNTPAPAPSISFNFDSARPQQPPSFSFGQPAGNQPAFGAASQSVSSRESTPVSGTPIPGRKIAQVKKRLNRR